MALQTINGFDPSALTSGNPVSANGIKEFANGAGNSPQAVDVNKDFRDAYNAPIYMMAVGVITGGVCTASGLTITFPSGSQYFAGQVWNGISDTTFTVTDNATTYAWGNTDGVIRTTSSTTPPIGWNRNTSCLIGRFVASSGVVTIDLTVQDKARTVDNTNRIVTEYNAMVGYGWVSEQDTVPSGENVIIPVGYQTGLYGPLTINGIVTINGRLRITD